eukprot:3500485-Rhodomonas_salina.2
MVLWAYAPATGCPVLSYRMVLPQAPAAGSQQRHPPPPPPKDPCVLSASATFSPSDVYVGKNDSNGGDADNNGGDADNNGGDADNNGGGAQKMEEAVKGAEPHASTAHCGTDTPCGDVTCGTEIPYACTHVGCMLVRARGTAIAYGDVTRGTEIAYGDVTCGTEIAYGAQGSRATRRYLKR